MAALALLLWPALPVRCPPGWAVSAVNGRRYVTGRLPRVGEVVEVSERDYRYGEGVLFLRVRWVGPPSDGWVELSGQDLRPDGTAILEGEVPRRAWVRVAGLRIWEDAR